MCAAETTVAPSSTKRAPAKRRQRWCQFSLRTLMIAMVAIATILGVGTAWYRSARTQATAVSTLRGYYNPCFYDGECRVGEFGKLRYVRAYDTGDQRDQLWLGLFRHISCVRLNPDGYGEPYSWPGIESPPKHDEIVEAKWRNESIWKVLSEFRHLEHLAVERPFPSDGSNVLKQFPNLRTLIVGRAVRLESLEPIAALESLEFLQLSGSGITLSQEFLQGIGKNRQLRHLGLRAISVNEVDLNELAKESKIESLDLTESKITGKAIEVLRSFSNLKRLSLRRTPVNDTWGTNLEQLTSLEELDVSETNAGPALLKSLSHLPNLRKLNTSRTDITGKAIGQFQNENPDCEFVWNGDPYR
jgi:hypothetical protein